MKFSIKTVFGMALIGCLEHLGYNPTTADIPDETFEVLGVDRDGDPAELYDALEWRYHDPEEGAGEGSHADFWDPILFSKYTNPTSFYEPPDKGKGSGRQGCVECHEKDTPFFCETSAIRVTER